TIPSFDASADANHDGYLSDAEFARHEPGMTARFVYESRAFYGHYGQMRFATNPADLGFRRWAVDSNVSFLRGLPLAQGLFVDNSAGVAPVSATDVQEPVAAYADDYASMLNAVARAISPKWVLANTAGGGASANPVVKKVQGYFEEF